VFGNGVPSKTSAPKGEEVPGDCSKLYNEDFHDRCCSPNVIRVIKLGGIKRAVHVACMGNRNA
jgi:hypothetical protein